MDGGLEFKGDAVIAYEEVGIARIPTSIYNPTRNGIVEARYFPIISYLTKVTDGS